MPRIDPLSLLKCLSVLLGPTGGIKSREEVHRLANLMTKFSKKLVSKCIYIQILKTTNTDLLSQFMGAGGWNLIHMWLTDGILAKNWALIQELLELLLLCPVDIERLKSNNCPKLIKGLSKEGSHQGVRVLASRLVEQWLKIVKGEAAPNSVPAQIMTVPVQNAASLGQNMVSQSAQQQQQQYSIHCGIQQVSDGTESATVHVQDLQFTPNSTSSIAVSHIQQQPQVQEQQQSQERPTVQSLQLQVVSKPQQVQIQQQLSSQQSKKPAFVVVSTSSQSPIPVYKITIREGKQILTKVETDAANINSVLNANSTNVEINGDVVDDTPPAKETTEEAESTELSDGVVSGQDCKADIVESEKLDQVSSEVKQTVIDSADSIDVEVVKYKENKDSKDNVSSESSKSSNKENRDSSKKDEKRSSSSDKKGHHSSSSSSKSSSKHTSSSSSHRSSSTSKSSSHRSSSSSSSSKSSSSKDKSSKDKDRHHSSNSSSKHSSSSKSKSDKEKEKQKKDQAEKDKATLEKVQGQALSSKLGKIPKKRSEEEKSGEAAVRKSSTDSRDSSKENKTDSKKVVVMPEKKNISISIESRKNSQDSTTRPKTVKTFNSKFRSTGLEEEVKPPPPRSAKKPNPIIEKKVIPQKLPALKRPSPLREAIPTADKRAKLSLDSPTTPPGEEKKGGIKLIPPKPKPMILQESDMFMDALTASTKSKEPRKRKRRTSITKDGPTDAKKQETATNDNRDVTPPPTSPPSADEKSPVVVKPNFKFYQDTLETDEDKEQKEKENSDDDCKKEKEETDDQKENRIFKPEADDDTGSNTPTPDDDIEEKTSDSPEDSSISDSSKKENSGSYPEIRYVDGLRSVLLHQKRKGPKKVLKWKTDLESVRYFELDETERVNVTKTFTDMKQMEKQNEREAFQMARKLSNEDLMEERTRWKPLIPIDLPPALVEPGKDSREKDIQYAREKGILQALYFNRSMIPESAAEPDEERHHVYSDPKIIPLDDLTGNKESEKDFTSMAWPEPKPQLQPPSPAVTNFHYPSFPHNQQPVMAPMGPPTSMGPMPQMSQQIMGPAHMGPLGPEMGGPIPAGGGGWRTGDGKVVVPDGIGMNPMGNMPNAFPPGMEGGPMVPPMMGPPPMYNQQQEGYGMMGPEDMGFNNMNPNNFQGPPGPMYGPGPNFQGPRGGGPMHGRGRGVPGPGWYRGGGGPPGRGGWRGGGGGWRGSGKQPPVCRQFSKNGYCRVGDKCQYLHPGVNCPPF
ncbi:phosphatase 1 nuclear targeting subunit isoform X2 [Nomia melanderi]|uniref:phosphatase 1 nuclear targeting subunit isoform X2 n=1 Tax=Nomia melanderi TaxID=2448451 RepID=UPI0013046B38|nr:serine/threonine-protein phosphatase 1 regulatory subunit 10-like isoform X2 [Nomia melanderi]XP_031843864.1 serine/threonine-protein phosphatase 1 regulatory subunit 10-like isoform X2 [Nomia melanderi]XP_031843865.1 serine/threonine-protein phosphatase 1 regulatory subunit 10-like isoform X2 [Nomia melanderi]XP_031843868.1 serine/threonine-protein phosphatase 1 regulatory subunit 10-like isoform X2 [Nomia melanderi]XP_031843869.1 serine/threonine-protein phosphatase 1 regulatory subunit 10